MNYLYKIILSTPLVLIALSLSAVSYQQAVSDIAYWDKRFPAFMDSIHVVAKQYYADNKIFTPIGKTEKASDYLVRLLKAYPVVKQHEFDPVLPFYSKLFTIYSQEVEMPDVAINMGRYDPYLKVKPVSLSFDNHKILVNLHLTPEQDLQLNTYWKTNITTVYGAYGINPYPSPSRIVIKSQDKSFSIDQSLPIIETIKCPNSNENLLVPVMNRILYFYEPLHLAESLYNPVSGNFVNLLYHLNCRSAVSNLMSNRMVGRTSYTREINAYNLVKLDFTLTRPPDTLKSFSDDEYDTSNRRDCGLSPEGRIVIHESEAGIYLYDFATGTQLARVSPPLLSDDIGNSYAFDPYDKKIYITGSPGTTVYNIVSGKIVSTNLGAKLTKTNNSGEQMAYWDTDNPVVKLMSLSTKDVRPFFLTSVGNTVLATSVLDVDFSPDDRLLGVLTKTKNENQSSLFVFDTLKGTLLRRFDLENINHITFTKDGQNLLCPTKNTEFINVVHLGIQPAELIK